MTKLPHSRRPTRDEVEAIYPLLPLQEGMLFHDLLDKTDQPYFRQVSFRIEGDFDPALCARTWNALMQRHALLRSVFDYENTTRLLQLVLKQAHMDFDEIDLSGLSPEAQAVRLTAYRAEDRVRGFDLRFAPPMRVRIFHLGNQRFEMLWSHSHILLDGWSGSLLLTDFAAIYAALRTQKPVDLPPPPSLVAYREHMAARDNAASRQFWAEALTGYDTMASLPRLGPNPNCAKPRFSRHIVALTADREAALNSLAAGSGVSRNTLLQALWGIILGRYTDSDDVVFGSVVSGRALPINGIERLVGSFINTIPVRVRRGKGEPLASLLLRLHHAAIENLEHDHLPLSAIQTAAGMPDGLLDHLLVFENYPQSAEEYDPALGFRVVAAEAEERAHYDFGLLVQPGSPLRLEFNYNVEAFTPSQIGRLGETFTTLIDRLHAAPHTPLDQISLLPEAELATLDAFSRGPIRPQPNDATIVAQWRAQAALCPDRLALCSSDCRMTYAALDKASEQLAAALAHLPEFRPRRPVGVLTGRGWRRIVALLGILKAGGIYLPLSPTLPDQRLDFLLGDTDCRIVLTDPVASQRLGRLRPGRSADIDALLAAQEPSPAANAEPITPDDLAYLLYTSGSTGQPKGVMVTHGGFINMVREQIAGFGIRADDRVLQFASCVFDASLSEIFMALLAGAGLVLAEADAVLEPHRLMTDMAAGRVSVVTLSPSYLAALDKPDFPGLRVLICAGEAVNPGDARHYASRLRVFNAYGPTEASVCASFHEVFASRSYPHGIPIGRPLANTRVRIVDRNGHPAPIGAWGEICLSGMGLARGYHNRSDLTQRFFVGEGSDREYRTGDCGQWTEDGDIMFRGRRDEQIKIHGRRIEPGEVEAALLTDPGIRQAAVLGIADTVGAVRLVAYVATDAAINLDALRSRLAATLPAFMIPAAVVQLATLPRTRTGKIDRLALPRPDFTATRQTNIDPPMTEVEQAVASAFATILGHNGVGRGDTFASLGGDSLAAVRVIGRLCKLGYGLSLRDLLTEQSVAAVARSLDRMPEVLPTRTSPPRGAAVPLAPSQAVFFARHHTEPHHYNQAVLLRAAKQLDTTALTAAVATLWRSHEALRLRFATDHTSQTAADATAPVPLATIDLRGLPDPWAALRTDAAARHRSFNLDTGPLFLAVHYVLDDADHVLLLAHHLVTDAVSWLILLEDLERSYQESQSGRTYTPPKTTSFLDWASTLNAYAHSGALDEQESAWLKVVNAPVMPLVTDFPVVPHGYDATRLTPVDIALPDPPLPDSAIQTVLVGALARALAHWGQSGATRILLTNNGRLAPKGIGFDTSRSIGWFAAEVPLLVPHAPKTTADLAQLRQAVDGTGTGAVAYGLLLQHGHADLRRCCAKPCAEIGVNYLGRIETHAASGGMFQPVSGLDGASAGRIERALLIELTAEHAGDRLSVTIRSYDKIHQPDSIERLAQLLGVEFLATVRLL